MFVYEADMRYDSEESVWYVAFPDFPGAFTDGETLEEAAQNAAEVLTLFVASCIDDDEPLPKPTFSTPPKTLICVEVDAETVLETACLSVSEAAEELGVTPGRVSQLLSTGGLEAVNVHGRRMVSIASVNRRKANPPAAHRPKKMVEATA